MSRTGLVTAHPITRDATMKTLGERASILPALLSMLCLLGGGCYGGLTSNAAASGTDGSSGGADDGVGSGDDGDGDGGDGSDGDDDDPPQAQCRAHNSPLRRLTTRQYINTLSDLFPGQTFDELTHFMPADAAVHGFENAALTQVPSPSLIEGYQRAAMEATAVVFADPAQVEATLGEAIPTSRADASTLAANAVANYGTRIFRRPMTDAERVTYVDVFEDNFEDTGLLDDDFVVALSMAFQAMLQAPAFVYLIEHGQAEQDAEVGELVALTSYEVASRLSYLLWDSMPDEALSAAAEAGELTTSEQIEGQVRRMLDEPAARAAVRNFHRQWLALDHVLYEMKDPARFPDWSLAMAEATAEQVERFAEHVFFDGEGTVAELLSSTDYPLNTSLASIFDGIAPDSDSWEVMGVDATRRRGLLTLPGILAAQAHPVNPSPVLRGVYIRERILCSPLPPPPDDADVTPPDSDDAEPLTNRERYDTILDDPSCAACHVYIHGLGFPFEHYDSVGAFRQTDNEQPIDASGEVLGVADVQGVVADATELAELLAQSDVAAECVAEQWYRQGFARDPDLAGGDDCMTDDLIAALAASGGDMRELLVALATSQDFTHRRIPAAEQD